MSDSVFQGIFAAEGMPVIALGEFLLCLGVALALGLVLAVCYRICSPYTKSFLATLALLPGVVCVVIMMVNGNIGAGVAVAGTFSLVRFRSVPGSGREITMVFLAMGAGLICGMGYLAYAVVFTLIMGVLVIAYSLLNVGNGRQDTLHKTIRVTIPEDLDYTGVFEDIFIKYTRKYALTSVKTTNMGSLFRLTYDITLKDAAKEKEMIDQLRCRNGNLEISVSLQETPVTEL